MKNAIIAAAALSMTFLTACGGDPCEAAGDRIVAVYDECIPADDTVEDAADDAEAAEVECTEALQTTTECMADCYEAASCEAVDGTDVDAGLELWDCVGAC